MSKGAVITLIVLIIIAIIVIWWIWWAYSQANTTTTPTVTPTSTTTALSTSTPAVPTFDQTLTDGPVSMMYPSADFGLATTSSGILMQATNIPPCSGTFNDCLYYINTGYAGTNFESAGVRVQNRTTLTTQANCLNTEPSGYTGIKPTVATSTDYAVSAFYGLNGGAAGNLSNTSYYRLFYSGACYEFETSVGWSDIANYPSGSIQEFTTDDQAAVQSEMEDILSTITLPTGETVVFPQA